MGTFLIIIAVAVFVIFLIAKSQQKSSKPEKIDYYTAALYSLNKSEKPRSNDDLYDSLKRQHQNKTLSEIRLYIEFRREQDDNYWAYHRMEYKILMELQSEQMNKEFDWLSKKAAKFTDETPYEELLDAYQRIRFHKDLYPTVDFGELEAKLAVQADKYFKAEIKNRPQTGVEKWLLARKKEGHYITKEIIEHAREIENSEPLIERLKRQRKNYQTAIIKAKRDNNSYLLIKYEELLAKNTEQLNAEKNKT